MEKKENMSAPQSARKMRKKAQAGEKYYYASQWTLMGRKFRRHKLAMASTVVLVLFYLTAILGNFIAPQGTEQYDGKYVNCAPTKIHFFHEGQFVGPFVYGLKKTRDPVTFMASFTENSEQIYRIRFFTDGGEGGEYKWFGLRRKAARCFCSARIIWAATCFPAWCWGPRFPCSFLWWAC